MEKCKEKYLELANALTNVCTSYSNILVNKIIDFEETGANHNKELSTLIVDELRVLNVLSVTCARCIAMAENQRFGVVHGDLPGTLPI